MRAWGFEPPTPGYREVVGNATPPAAPWELAGECVVALVRAPVSRPSLAVGLQPLPGPLVVAASRFTESPVGPYLELSVAEPARLAARIGLCVTLMVVDSPDSRLGGRLNWGLPKELGTLRWLAEADERTLAWEDRDVVVRGVPSGPSVPMVAPVRSLQRRADGLVVVGGHLRGHARPAKVEITAPDDDGLAGLTGCHRGMVVSGLRLVINPARRPAGLTATLRAPLRAPEPALSWSGDAPRHPHGRLAQR
jgi:Acetoacetate decarboxylase (ADC)